MNCLNCKKEIDVGKNFCAHCGQKTKKPQLSLWAILSDFISNVFNFDAKIYKTLLHLFVPGKLTHSYVSGQRNKYYPPIRILFFSMVIYFGLLASLIGDAIPDLNKISNDNHTALVENDLFERMDSLAPIYISEQGLPSLDSLKKATLKREATSTDSYLMEGEDMLGVDFNKLKIKTKDVFDLSDQELLEKYKIEGRLPRMLVSIVKKCYTKPGGIPKFLISNMLWSVILGIFLTGMLMKLLYIRRKKKYVEHLVFLMHTHAAVFVFLGLTLLIMKIFNMDIYNVSEEETRSEISSAAFINLSFLPGMIFFFIAMMRYYKQGFFKTLIKYGVIGFIYMMVFSLVAIFVSAISLYFFE